LTSASLDATRVATVSHARAVGKPIRVEHIFSVDVQSLWPAARQPVKHHQ